MEKRLGNVRDKKDCWCCAVSVTASMDHTCSCTLDHLQPTWWFWNLKLVFVLYFPSSEGNAEA